MRQIASRTPPLPACVATLATPAPVTAALHDRAAPTPVSAVLHGRRSLTHAAVLLASVLALPPLPSAVAADRAPVCSLATIESLPSMISKVSVARLKGDLPGARKALTDEPLLSNMEILLASLESCATAGKEAKDVERALVKLNDEVDYQLGKYGVYAENEGSRRELEKIQDPEDLQDFNVAVNGARRAVERYLQAVPR